MDTVLFEYGFLWIIILLTFFSFLIGIHKMLQVIVSTSFIILVLLGRSGFLSFVGYYIWQQPDITFFSFSNIDIVSFIQSADTTTSLLIFVWLIIYAIHYANNTLHISSSLFSSKLTQIFLAPLAILSMILCLSVAVIGIDIFSLGFLQKIGSSFTVDSVIYKYIFFLPLGIICQWLFTLILLFQKENSISSYDEL
jgi:hypothetical protein